MECLRARVGRENKIRRFFIATAWSIAVVSFVTAVIYKLWTSL